MFRFNPCRLSLVLLFVTCTSAARAESIMPVFITETVADYTDDFQGPTPKSGWSYWWNENGEIGNPANYEPLMWTGGGYDYDGVPGTPSPGPAQYVSLGSGGGHPGGPPSTTIDRYAIAAFTVSEEGEYSITDSFVTRPSASGNGNTLWVNVNEDTPLIDDLVIPSGTVAPGIPFNMSLGMLSPGDTIYFGIGPNGDHGNDSFGWDFTIQRTFDTVTPEPSSYLLFAACLGSLGYMTWRRRRAAA